MSSYFFSFPLDNKLQTTIDGLLADHAQGKYADPAVSSQIAVGTTDGVIKALALDVIDILKHSGEDGAGILSVLAGLLKSTMHVLIKQIMGKVDKGEQDKLAGYLNSRRVYVGDQARFGFELPAALGARFDDLLGQIRAGQIAAARPGLTTAMTDFTEVAVKRFYDEFTGSLDLGFVKRKLVDVGRSTVLKGSHTAVNKLFGSLSDDELKQVAAHYDTMFTKA
ncbi:hypothetical protein [Amnimonas aquatica]|mgnify:CR=1 FL=1|uniref:Uncharacterized protein n=1 Tax=Amnimonas aquatica TaxID=2094561 RepID=A0A2P6ATF9_9GAMM|nr:hypothetical protein [Amnimonas aquatica]PQA46760.1 hypothetical protein C5O18_04165 [Amnimonas aquatica]